MKHITTEQAHELWQTMEVYGINESENTEHLIEIEEDLLDFDTFGIEPFKT